MNRTGVIALTESRLKKLVSESVKRVLAELNCGAHTMKAHERKCTRLNEMRGGDNVVGLTGVVKKCERFINSGWSSRYTEPTLGETAYRVWFTCDNDPNVTFVVALTRNIPNVGDHVKIVRGYIYRIVNHEEDGTQLVQIWGPELSVIGEEM